MEKDKVLNLLQNGLLLQVHGAYYEALKMAIDDWKMEQKEPFINKPCVSEQACHEDKVKVLEKIKAEIERRGGNDEKAFCKSLNESYKLGLREAIEIIDKYIAESEDKE